MAMSISLEGQLAGLCDNKAKMYVCVCIYICIYIYVSRRLKRYGFDPWVRKIPWRRAWQPTSVFLPGESHGQRSLAGYSP